jgi:uncharacterized protein DUF4259
MGAWGIHNFESDESYDFSDDLFEKGIYHLPLVLENFANLSDEEYLEAHVCTYALIAAECLAFLLGNKSLDFPEDLAEWLEENNKLVLSDDVIENARICVGRICQESELKQLWEETGEIEDWLEVQNGLKRRLVFRMKV